MEKQQKNIDADLSKLGIIFPALNTHCGLSCDPTIRQKLSILKVGQGISIFPKIPATYSNSRLYFYLMAKELYLSGFEISILSINFLMHICEKYYIKDYLKNTGVFNNHYIFIPDFCEDISPGPISGKQGLMLYKIINDIKDANIGIFTLSSVPRKYWAGNGWWGKAYLNNLLKDSVLLRVGEEQDVEWFEVNTLNN